MSERAPMLIRAHNSITDLERSLQEIRQHLDENTSIDNDGAFLVVRGLERKLTRMCSDAMIVNDAVTSLVKEFED